LLSDCLGLVKLEIFQCLDGITVQPLLLILGDLLQPTKGQKGERYQEVFHT